MSFPIDQKLVIAVASSALFDLTESDAVFQEKGVAAYRQYQRDSAHEVLKPGVAFPFIRRLLKLNACLPSKPVEVVLLSRNDPDTGLRVQYSIGQHRLDITRAAFMGGRYSFNYLAAFNAALFLSANPDDVRKAIEAGYAAGTVLGSNTIDDQEDLELRIAFDFDGVLASDESERVYQENAGDLFAYQQNEIQLAQTPLQPGPLHGLLRKLAFLQQLERQQQIKDPHYRQLVRTHLITARNAPAHERVVTTLRSWGVVPDETLFLGGIEKRRFLEVMRPHIFFDDQLIHLDPTATSAPCVHIPFGIANKSRPEPTKSEPDETPSKSLPAPSI